MAAGRPVVARRVGALPETVVDGETGILLERDEPEALGHALADLLANPARARAMGQAGRRRAHEVFGPERVVSTVERAYLALR
jgi:glycosyltransferase involved in cell wall biosynthesis